jgi:formylglycine-generating enzyme required for sulfatase activity
MNGNVWEAVWTFGDVLDPASNPDITVVGGDFLQSRNPEEVSASPWGDTPYDGSWNIGFRVVRRDPGLPGPASGTPPTPKWQISANTKTVDDAGRQSLAEDIPLADIPGEGISLGACEVNFAQWKQVFNWAVANGFEFDHGGEMGSMAYWGWGEDWKPRAHSPSEPVAGISHYDSLVWLNALSTMQGKTPVYYHDKALTKPYKTAYRFRPLMLWLGENTELRMAGVINHWWQEKDLTFDKKDADGYRLPTTEEFEHAQFGGADAPDWNGDHASVAANAWLLESSGLRTHPVGKLAPNAFGLYDMAGNVSEWSHDTNVGKNKGCVAERVGGGFFDPAVVQGASSVPTETTRGLMYPDVGFRIAVQTTVEEK